MFDMSRSPQQRHAAASSDPLATRPTPTPNAAPMRKQGAEQGSDTLLSELGTVGQYLPYVHSHLRDFGPEPLVIDHGEGVYVFDTSGRRYLDAMSGYWLACLGYADEELLSVLNLAARRLSFWHQFGTTHVEVLEYVRDLLAHLPHALRGKILFANTGSGAMEIALRVACARGASKKPAVIAHLDRSYHGSTFLTQQATPWNDWPCSLRLMPHQVLRLPAPVTEGGASDALAVFERACNESRPPTILLTEPVQGVGGMAVPPGWFFEQIGALCRRYGVVWVSDEISTSFGSTGLLFAFERCSILPDIVVVGKKMAAGYFPMAAAIVSKALTDEVLAKYFHHGYSTSAHPVGCEAARVVLRRVSDPKTLRWIQERGQQLREGLLDLQRRHSVVRSVNGLGLMLSLELPKSSYANRVTWKLRELGVYELPEGKYLTFCPPFIIAPEQVDELISALDGALAGS